jgi:iron complex transport system substrate-binding protein
MMMQITSARRTWRVAGAAAVVAACAILGTASAAGVNVRDATGRTVTISDPGRIVSIGGSVTEILYALGQEQRIAAIDITSLYPANALKEKPNVGYLRQLSPEGVLGLSPTLVLASEGAGPKEAVSVIESAKVPFVHVPDQFTGEGIVEKIKLIAAATGQDKRGECLARTVETDLAALARIRANVTKPARVVFLLSFMNGRAMVAGRNTAADGIIRLAGAVNAISEFEGYKVVSDEALIAAQPDSVLAMERSNYKLTADEAFSHAAFSVSPAARNKSFVSMDGLYLLGFGPRTAKAARDLAHSFYPSLETGKLPSESAISTDDACRS